MLSRGSLVDRLGQRLPGRRAPLAEFYLALLAQLRTYAGRADHERLRRVCDCLLRDAGGSSSDFALPDSSSASAGSPDVTTPVRDFVLEL